jgi:decaprenyl-phosphate phosphoribosyltransferase
VNTPHRALSRPDPPAPVVAVRPNLLRAALRTARPNQWPKNLLVLAAPLAAGTTGRYGQGAQDLALALLAFTCASAGVYFVNDVLDAERDRSHPRKRLRPIASGQLGERRALALALLCVLAAEACGLVIDNLWFTVTLSAYIATCLLYSGGLKHLPGLELLLVASGFVLRALGGAAAGRIPPSGWFVLVCSLGALLMATAKRAGELSSLAAQAAAVHRPSLRRYSLPGLRRAERLIAAAMLAAYLAWALAEHDPWTRAWHLATLLPLTAALLRFDHLAARNTPSRVEDLLMRDRPMLGLELLWLVLFTIGVRPWQ